jgi:hypothetical protein
MTEDQYSPATQAVSDAVEQVYWDWGNLCPADAHTIAAAALRAAVDAVDAVTDEATPGQSVWGEGFYEGVCSTCDDLLAIAKELEEL